jgi:hypothetical protein
MFFIHPLAYQRPLKHILVLVQFLNPRFRRGFRIRMYSLTKLLNNLSASLECVKKVKSASDCAVAKAVVLDVALCNRSDLPRLVELDLVYEACDDGVVDIEFVELAFAEAFPRLKMIGEGLPELEVLDSSHAVE